MLKTLWHGLFYSHKKLMPLTNTIISINKISFMKTLLQQSKLSTVIFLLLSLCFASVGFAQTTIIYPSTGTFTPPAGSTIVTAECWGGGGKGGTRTTTGAASGGGGGAYSKGTATVAAGTSYTVTVGTGSTSTAAGLDSWFLNATTVMAKGGVSSSGNNINTSFAGGSSLSGFGNLLKTSGGNSAIGTTGSFGGGGASSGGTAVDGNFTNTTTNQSAGGIIAGGGTGGAGRSGSSGVGFIGNVPGGGGGGAYRTSNNTSNGGNGADGQVSITYTCVSYSLTSVTATTVCPGSASTVTIANTTTANLPVGTYTVTYSLSGGNTAANQIAIMTVSIAGTGTFTTIALTNPVSTTITINSLASGSGVAAATLCTSTLASGNTGTILFTSTAIATVPNTRCGSGVVSLTATNSGCFTSTIDWYAAPTGGASLFTGSPYAPTVAATTNYYVEESLTTAETSFGASSSATVDRGLVFNLTEPIVLNSVQVKSSNAVAGIIMGLRDNAGVAISGIADVTFNLVTNNAVFTVPLNWTIPAGTGYRLLLISNPNAANLVRTSPYTFPKSLVVGSITSSIEAGAVNSSRYNFFYNWNISRVRTLVTATVNPVATVNAGSANTICTGAAYTLAGATIGGGATTGTWSITGVTGTMTNATSQLSDLTATANPQNVTFTPIAGKDGTVTLTLTTDDPTGPCAAVSATVVLTVNGYTWTGDGNNTTWADAANWPTCGVPASGTDFTIATAATKADPVLTSNLTVGAITFTPGTTLTIGSNTLTVNGSITGTGTLTGSAASNLVIGGTAGTVNFTTGAQILKDLTINTGASATLGTALDITAGAAPGTVTVTGTLNTAGLLTIKSNATGTARVGPSTGAISGNVTVERYVQAHRAWRFLAAPVQSATAPTINAAWQEGLTTASANPNLYPGFGTHITGGNNTALGFDVNPSGSFSTKESTVPNSWSNIPNTITQKVSDQEGYMVFVRGSRANNLSQGQYATADATTLRIKGALKTGPQTYTNGTGLKVIGNPYASAISLPHTYGTVNGPMNYSVWDPLITGTNSVGGFVQYIWNDVDNVYDQTTLENPLSPIIAGVVESGSAFIVTFHAGAATLTLNEADKIAGSNQVQLVNVVGEQMRVLLKKVNPDATVSLQDAMLTNYNGFFSNLVDAYDAVKVTNFTQSMSSKRDGKKLAIERRAVIVNTDTSYLDLIQMSAGNYQLQLIADNLNHPNLLGKLVDNYTSSNTVLSLHGSTTYAFVVDANAGSFAADRFKVVYYAAAPLPVSFTSIKATQQNKDIAVEWQVANQVNISKYEVEKSTDGRHFTAVATQQPIGINGANATYNWLDVNAVTGDHFYRISSTGLSGDIKLSSIVKVTIGKGIPAIVVYPNPVVNNTVTLQFTDMPKGDYGTRLINMLGQTVQSKQLTHSGSNTTQSFAISQGIAKGNYQLQIITPAGEKLNQKIVITE